MEMFMMVIFKMGYYKFISLKKKHGQGVYEWAPKGENPSDKYEGDFKDDLKHGIGKMNYTSKNESYYGIIILHAKVNG